MKATKTDVAKLFRVTTKDVTQDQIILHSDCGLSSSNCNGIFNVKSIALSSLKGRKNGTIRNPFQFYEKSRPLITRGPKFLSFVDSINNNPDQSGKIVVAYNRGSNKVHIIDGKHRIYAAVNNMLTFENLLVSVKIYMVDMKGKVFERFIRSKYKALNKRFKLTACHRQLMVPDVKKAIEYIEPRLEKLESPYFVCEPDQNVSNTHEMRRASTKRMCFYLLTYFENIGSNLGDQFDINPRRGSMLGKESNFIRLCKNGGLYAELDRFIEILDELTKIVMIYLSGPYNLKNNWGHYLAGMIAMFARLNDIDRDRFMSWIKSGDKLDIETGLTLISHLNRNSEPYNIAARAARDTFVALFYPGSYGVIYNKDDQICKNGDKVPHKFIYRYTVDDPKLKILSINGKSNSCHTIKYDMKAHPIRIG